MTTNDLIRRLLSVTDLLTSGDIPLYMSGKPLNVNVLLKRNGDELYVELIPEER